MSFKNSSSNWGFSVVLGLFFLTGFCSVFNTIMVPFLQERLGLSYTLIASVYVSFYLAYFLFSPLSGFLLHNKPLSLGIKSALFISFIGCFILSLAGTYGVFFLVLIGVFVMGGGIAVGQVSGNPYILYLGEDSHASQRLTFSQAITSLGTVLAPFIGSLVILATINNGIQETFFGEMIDILSLEKPYFYLSSIWGILFLLVHFFPLPTAHIKSSKWDSFRKIPPYKEPIVRIGFCVLAIAIGAEVTVGSYLIPLFSDQRIMGLTFEGAGQLAIFYWLGFMLGRLFGSMILTFVSARNLLFTHATAAICLALTTSFVTGLVAAYSALFLGLCMSIMFPVIFSLIVQNSESNKIEVSGLLCMANLGGAILPVLQGLAADQVGISLSFLVPTCCFVIIAYFSYHFPRLIPPKKAYVTIVNK